MLGSDHLNPRLKAKRLAVNDIVLDVINSRALVFRFAPCTTPLELGDGRRDLVVLTKKLLVGGLATQLDTMQSRTLSAEQHLLALVDKDADEAGGLINQLKEFVQGTCSDARTFASAQPPPWGLEMYRQLVTQLRNAADKHPGMVHHKPYECLMGVAGLLTEDCRVWWSPEFDLKEAV